MNRLGPLGFLCLVFAPVAASAVFVVWTRVTTLRLGYELARTQAALKKLDEANAELEATVATGRTPRDLTRIGRKLGLAEPVSAQLEAPRKEGRR